MQTVTELHARERLIALIAMPRSRPFLLGITGAPGAGKSTFADSLGAPVLPMDGYHFANEHLDLLGMRGHKGAPATFDVDGFVSALTRLAAGRDVVVPRFDRAMDAAVAGAIALSSDSKVIVVEGNYLLHDRDGWQHVRGLLNEVWYIDVSHTLRQQRLIGRHQQFGRTAASAAHWAAEVDEPNAELIRATRHRADAVITFSRGVFT